MIATPWEWVTTICHHEVFKRVRICAVQFIDVDHLLSWNSLSLSSGAIRLSSVYSPSSPIPWKKYSSLSQLSVEFTQSTLLACPISLLSLLSLVSLVSSLSLLSVVLGSLVGSSTSGASVLSSVTGLSGITSIKFWKQKWIPCQSDLSETGHGCIPGELKRDNLITFRTFSSLLILSSLVSPIEFDCSTNEDKNSVLMTI